MQSDSPDYRLFPRHLRSVQSRMHRPVWLGTHRRGCAVSVVRLVGAVFAGSSVIWEVETWSLFRATATHFCIVTPLFWIVSLLLGWCSLNLWGMLLYLGIFLCIYLSIWLSQYSVYRRKIRKINQKLQEDTKQ